MRIRVFAILLALLLALLPLSMASGLTLPPAGETAAPVAASARPTAATPRSWEIETVDTARAFSSISFAVDQTGRPHIAYGEYHLYHAWHDGISWQVETVDPARNVGNAVAIAIDAAARPRIAYYDSANQDLKYAAFDGTAWQIETVDRAGDVGQSPYLALDSSGWPHITYWDATNQYPKYATPGLVAWRIETIDPAANAGKPLALALDSDNHPHVSYFDIASTSLRYAQNDGTGWLTATVEISGCVWPDASIALGSDDLPRLAYQACRGDCVKVATYDGTIWSSETITSGHGLGQSPSLQLDAADRPRVSFQGYYDVSQGIVGARDPASCPVYTNLWYAWNDGAGWQTMLVAGSGCGVGSSMILDTAGRPHIGFTDWVIYSSSVRHAWNDGGGWQVETVGGVHATFLGLASTPTDELYLAYWEERRIEGSLYIAQNDGSGWIQEPVDADTLGGLYPSLAMDTSGRPHVSYIVKQQSTPTRWSLRYAYHDGINWHTETVDGGEGSSPGDGTTLALDAASRPHIAYREDDGLQYAWYDGSAWHVEELDAPSPGGIARSGPPDPQQLGSGYYVDLVLDSANFPHLCYNDYRDIPYQQKVLKYVYYDGMAWQTEVVDASGVPEGGSYCSLALDMAGEPRIAYGRSYSDLMYARREGTVWYTETVVPGDGGFDVSLALDAADYPHIGYCLEEDGYECARIGYSTWDGSAWSSTVVDTGKTYYEPTLVLDAAGRPLIAYGAADCSTTPCSPAQLLLAEHNGVTWTVTVVDEVGPAFYTGGDWLVAPSPALDADGYPHIAYRASNDLLYARAVPCVALAGVAAAGPTRLPAGRTGLYMATVTPYSSTVVTLEWDNGTVGPQATYGWLLAGLYSLTVTATNACSIVSATQGVEVFCQTPQAVQVVGPSTLVPNLEGTFVAGVQPLTASLPLTWTWDNGTQGEAAGYSWLASGTYTITVTGTNGCGQAAGRHTVVVLDRWPYAVYLPLVVRE